MAPIMLSLIVLGITALAICPISAIALPKSSATASTPSIAVVASTDSPDPSVSISSTTLNQETSTVVPNISHHPWDIIQPRGRVEDYPTPKELKGAILDDKQCFSRDQNYISAPGDIMYAAHDFCASATGNSSFNGAAAPVGRLWMTYNTEITPALRIAVYDVDKCSTGDSKELRWVGQPHKDYSCYDLLYGAWNQCDNGGRGGAVDAGCLRFAVVPFVDDWRVNGDGWHEIDNWVGDAVDYDVLDGVNFNDLGEE